jgi:acetate kinase
MVEALHARPSAVHVAAFDTAFHHTIPDVAAVYAIPREWTDRWGIRRFGFHGLSVAYATQQAAQMCQGVPARHVVCHLGAGCSVTAVREGKSIDTSMGFTPLDGVMMATRSGAIDPGIAPFLVRRGFTVDQLNDSLEHLSGLRGVSGVSGDIRDVLRQAAAGDQNCTLAYEMFIYSVSRMIGAMVAALGGLDMLTFTGGVGERQPPLRQRIASQLDYLGVSLNRRLNEDSTGDRDIAADSSRTRVLVIKAREDLSILREIRSFI